MLTGIEQVEEQWVGGGAPGRIPWKWLTWGRTKNTTQWLSVSESLVTTTPRLPPSITNLYHAHHHMPAQKTSSKPQRQTQWAVRHFCASWIRLMHITDPGLRKAYETRSLPHFCNIIWYFTRSINLMINLFLTPCVDHLKKYIFCSRFIYVGQNPEDRSCSGKMRAGLLRGRCWCHVGCFHWKDTLALRGIVGSAN